MAINVTRELCGRAVLWYILPSTLVSKVWRLGGGHEGGLHARRWPGPVCSTVVKPLDSGVPRKQGVNAMLEKYRQQMKGNVSGKDRSVTV
ncbi:hypothetical protein E2C01_024447 [Portunus trituberculatus]|uniref:Uncharacterized protein n=1 Tax=Portunus trituberculatus TaxID=210409 RepID=A0A5B7ED70_PORTR|nr:hypothetical protein [Portunus trituberculatus]